jgi:hypothetical protein
LEGLEERSVPTIIYKPVFGVETTRQNDNEHGIQPKVYLTFWGSYWSGVGASQVALVQAAASKVVTSTFPLIVNQYGADGHNMTIAGTAIDNSNPSSGNFDPEDDVDNVVQNQIDNGKFPESDADANGNDNSNGNDHSRIYVVITPPNVVSNVDPNVVGNNAVESDLDFFSFDFDDIGECWVGTGGQPGGTVSIDSFSQAFSHEIAEIMSDWDSEGYEVNPPSGAPNGSGNQIGDYEGNSSYCFRLSNGVDVQALWSRADYYPGFDAPGQGAWAVYDGTNQKFFLDGTGNWSGNKFFNGKYALTILGDQNGNVDDNITVGTGANDGVEVTENGETVNFDPLTITSITINAGTGTNTININPLPFEVNNLTIGSVGGTIKLVAPKNQANTWNITGPNSGTLDDFAFSNVSSLTGGSISDTFNFLPGGSIPGNIDGGGSATLDYHNLAGPITVNLQTQKAPGIGGTFSGISHFIGSASTADTLIGPDAAWVINGANAGTVNGLTFSSFENLTGGSGPDQFQFKPGGSVSGNIDGGGSSNTLDYAALAGPVTVNLQTQTAPGIGGTFANITSLVGSAGSDTLVGPNAAATWAINGANAGSVNGLTFSSFENLTGGSAADHFVFLSGGSVAGNIDGGGGSNSLDYSQYPGPITLSLASNTATGIGGTYANIATLIANSNPNNTLVGPNTSNNWLLTGPNTVTLGAFTFSGFGNLVGGSAADQFVIKTGASLSGKIDGAGGINTLDYSTYTGDVTVDLALNLGTAIGGGVVHIQNVTGSIGNDLMVGDANPNVLKGGTGRNVIIGGAGADTIFGGGGDNILIGGTTVYDTNFQALQAIMAEWTRTDLSFEQRLAHLISEGDNDGRLNGPYVLNNKTVFADGAPNAITGGDGLDWVFLDKKDDLFFNWKPKDHITEL